MKIHIKTPLVCSLITASMLSIAQAQVGEFDEDFTGATLNPIWNESGATGTFDAGNDLYQLTNDKVSGSAASLQRAPGGSISDYTEIITIQLVDFMDPNTSSDFKWKTNGADGSTDIILNSFGNLTFIHNDYSGGQGALLSQTNIGTSDGNVVTLKKVFWVGSDTITLSYSINGGAEQQVYSGLGIEGVVGSLADVITNSTAAELGQWGDTADDPTVKILDWSLSATAVPEPSAYALLTGCVGLAFVMTRRRR